jgi:hypothetical protein
MTTPIQFLRAVTLIISCGIPALSLAQVETGRTPGVTKKAQHTKTGSATVTIIAMTQVDYPAYETAKKHPQGNSDDASHAIQRSANAPTGSKATKGELIVDFQ